MFSLGQDGLKVFAHPQEYDVTRVADNRVQDILSSSAEQMSQVYDVAPIAMSMVPDLPVMLHGG